MAADSEGEFTPINYKLLFGKYLNPLVSFVRNMLIYQSSLILDQNFGITRYGITVIALIK